MVTVVFFYDIMRAEEKMLLEKLRERGGVEVVHTTSTPLRIGEPPVEADSALARGVSGTAAFYASVVAESWGLPVVNPSRGMAIARDKAWSQAVLAASGVPTPNGSIVVDARIIPEAVKLHGYPAVVKPVRGSWGRLVSIVRDEIEAYTVSEHRQYMASDAFKTNVVQEYIRKPDRDARLFCVDGRIVAAIYRIGGGFVATNIAQGAKAEPLKPPADMEEIAVKACTAMGLDVGGVDVIEDPEKGYMVLEVNPSPEFKTTVRVTGVDVPGLIADVVVSKARR